MLGIRFAGDKLKQFDTAYAQKVAAHMGDPSEHPVRHMLGATPISEIGDVQADSPVEALAGQLAAGGVRATNAGYRYGLPAAGITLAGVGIHDLATGQNGNGELPM